MNVLTPVELTVDLPPTVLKKGQKGTITHVFNGVHVEVEFTDDFGKPIAVVTIPRLILKPR